jgi:tetratricopeptide (TPR) repeat protein
LLGGLLLASLLCVAVRAIITKQIVFRRSPLDLPIIALVVAALVSALSSGMIQTSMLGRNDYFSLSVVYLGFLALFYFLVLQVLTSPRRWMLVFNVLVSVGAATAGLFVLKAIFHVDIFNWLTGYNTLSNSIEGFNGTFGVWLVIIFVLSAGQLIKKNIGVASGVLYGLAAALTFVGLILLSFKLIWWVMLVSLLLLLLLGIGFIREARLAALSVLFALLILVIIFIAFDTPRSFQYVMPIETILSFKSSWVITSQTLVSGAKNLFLGSGPGSFAADFSQFRSRDFNADPVAWTIRFNAPFSTFFALLAEGGLLLAIIFGFLTVSFAGHALSGWLRIRLEGSAASMNALIEKTRGLIAHWETFLVVISWFTLTVGAAIIFYGPVLWWLWWTMLALAMSGLIFIQPRLTSTKKMTIANTPEYNLSFSFIVIVLMAVIAVAGVWGARLYVADIYYATALATTRYADAEQTMKKALSLREDSEVYHTALAQIYLLQAVNESRVFKPDVAKISGFMASAVNEAKRATDLKPGAVATWENLATMYENASTLIPEAREWAIKSLVEAAKLEPTNPVLVWRLGNNYALSGKFDEAAKAYNDALFLKSDYLGAKTQLANAYEQSGKIDKAVDAYKEAVAQAPTNIEILFNYGRLLYNRNLSTDRADATKVWLEAVRLQPNYSNALYSLGLAYETKGEKNIALQYYYRVQDLNPDNKDVASKIKALVKSGR